MGGFVFQVDGLDKVFANAGNAYVFSGAGAFRSVVLSPTVGASGTHVAQPSGLGYTTSNYFRELQSPDPYFNGGGDDFRIYARALAAAEQVRWLTPIIFLDCRRRLPKLGHPKKIEGRKAGADFRIELPLEVACQSPS